MRLSGTHYKGLLLIAGPVLLLDQLTKWLVLRHLPLNDSLTVIGGFFNIAHIHNPGGAFGLLADQTTHLRHFFFIAASLAALLVILYLYRKTPTSCRLLSSGLCLIFGGALGNLADRIRMGKVVDFLDFHINNWHWPAFNVADSAITIGIMIFVYHLVIGKLPE